ncbi:brain and acute leukemia cytoplasmic protein [Alligator mississippiensis]|uniref:Brain and acute leukemia cytoplasmic protein n=1 Tax=Alligator mississippiensis TaxID=8496 RepID=A0A151MXX8_ALLMI|nr:brain and acute leukemia cytoplasmic protein [Alligator mississippiensis]
MPPALPDMQTQLAVKLPSLRLCRRLCSGLLPAAAQLGSYGILEEGKSTQTCVTMSSSACGMLNTEKKASCGTQCSKSTLHATGTMTQKQHGFRTAEAKWDTKKMPTKEVAINVTKSIRQINSDRRTTKNCVN